jgi:hypothetical protein
MYQVIHFPVFDRNSGMVGSGFEIFFPVPFVVTWLYKGHKLTLLAGHLRVSYIILVCCSGCETHLRYTLQLEWRWLGATTMTECLLTWFCSSHFARLIFHSNGFDPDRYVVLHCVYVIATCHQKTGVNAYRKRGQCHNICNIQWLAYGLNDQGRRQRVRGPAKKKIPPPPPRKDGPAKNFYTKSERLTLSRRVTLAWAERVNLYSGQIIIQTDKYNNICNIVRPRAPFRTAGPRSFVLASPPSRRHCEQPRNRRGQNWSSPKRPDRLWSSSSPLFNRYRQFFPGEGGGGG